MKNHNYLYYSLRTISVFFGNGGGVGVQKPRAVQFLPRPHQPLRPRRPALRSLQVRSPLHQTALQRRPRLPYLPSLSSSVNRRFALSHRQSQYIRPILLRSQRVLTHPPHFHRRQKENEWMA